jgi:lysozyme
VSSVPKKSLVALVGVVAAGALLKAVPTFEGMVLVAKPDPVGVVTACNGETQGIKLGQRFTLAQCIARLEPRLADYAAGADQCTPLEPLSPMMRAAVVDFSYNEGVATYCASSIAANVRVGNLPAACRSFNESPKGKPQYVFAGGEQLPGLVARRAKERTWCEEKP